jgi:hypothetical protein
MNVGALTRQEIPIQPGKHLQITVQLEEALTLPLTHPRKKQISLHNVWGIEQIPIHL